MKILFLGVVFTTLSFSALASKDLSLDISLGQSHQRTSFNGNDSVKGDDFSLGIRAEYRLIENLKLELSLNDYKESVGSYIDEESIEQDSHLTTKSFDIGIKYGVNLLKNFTLYGHLGVSSWRMNIKKDTTALSNENNQLDDNNVYYALSLDYDHNDNDAFGLEYKIINIDYQTDNLSISNKVRNLSIYFKSKF
ncbi:MAG: outer membrane beta-barrel protein [Paraglaciecola sp.]|uniref:outer membrane beta-barrel protein n=1 Tax=Paraglaciecola TaxID=1621534 RepID=UPI00105FB485|nr:outer membrane beta-barrel protein [Paraglaciecola marina]